MSFLDELFPETNIDTTEQWAGLNPDTAAGLSSAMSFARQLGVTPEVTETVRPDNEQPEGGSSNSNHYARNGARAADLAWAGMQWGDPQFNATADHLESQGYSVIRDPHGTGPHIHFESQPAEDRNPIDKALFGTAEASPAQPQGNFLDELFATSTPTAPTKADGNFLDALFSGTPAPVQQEQPDIAAQAASSWNPSYTDTGIGRAINDYVTSPITHAVGTVLEYADKPRGALAGAAEALQNGGNIIEGAKTGWDKNTSFKNILPDNLVDSPVGNAIGTAGKVLLNPLGLAVPAQSAYNSIPDTEKNNMAKTVVGLGMDVALDPLWVATPAKVVAGLKMLEKIPGVEKVSQALIQVVGKVKDSETLEKILQHEVTLPGIGKMTVKRALSEEGPLTGLLDKMQLDKAKLNEEATTAGKVLEPLTIGQKKNVTRMIEAKAADGIPALREAIPVKDMDEYFNIIAADDKVPVKTVLEREVGDWSKIINDTVTEMRSYDRKGSSGVFYNEMTGKHERVIKSVNENPLVQSFVTKNGRMPKSDEWYKLAEDYVLREAPYLNNIRERAMDAQDYLGRISKAEKGKAAETALFEADGISSATRPQLIEKMTADGLKPEEIKQVETVADSLSNFSKGRSKELLDRGIISQETYDKYYGRYIRREYLKHENPEQFIVQLREAGNVKEADLLQQAVDKVGNNVQKRSNIKMNWNDIKQRQQLTEAEQEMLGRVMDATHPFAKGGAVSSDLIAKYDFLEGVAQQFGKGEHQLGYQLLTGKGFGPLENMWVPKEVFNEVTNTVGKMSEADGFWRKAVSWWKMGKTILNPAGHARNFMSNALLLDMAGMNPVKIPGYLTRAAEEMLEKGKYYKEAKDNTSLLLNTYKKAEALQLNKPGRLKTVVDKAGDLYQGNEVLGKMAAFIHQREAGKSIEEAAKFANAALFDYGKVPPVVDYLRRSGLVPFASFPYFATKATAKTLYKDPARVLKYYKPMISGQTEQDKAQKELYPKWMNPNNYIPMGKSTRMKDGKKQEVDQFLDASYIYPFDSDVSVSPAFSLAASLATNKNWLTGNDIARKGMTPTDKTEEYFKYAAQQLLPSFAPYGYSQEKLVQAFKGEMDKSGRQYTLPEAVAHTVFGLKNVPINTDEMARQSFIGIRTDIMDTRAAMKGILRDKRYTPAQKATYVKEYQNQLKQLAGQAETIQKAYKTAKGKDIE